MECPRCRGPMQPGFKTSTVERGETTLVIRDVPATICTQCGEAVFDADTSDRVRELLDDAVRNLVVTSVQRFHFAEIQHTAIPGSEFTGEDVLRGAVKTTGFDDAQKKYLDVPKA